jgi:hypothetical protein
VWRTAAVASLPGGGRAARVLLRALILLGIGVLLVPWYAHATRDYLEVRVRAENVRWSVLVNCVKFVSQPGVDETLDLGWLRPQDVVSVEFTSDPPRSDGTVREGYFQVERRLNRGNWETLKALGTSGASVEPPPF